MVQITEEFIESISRKDILSLDIATKTGFYNIYEHGMVKFPNNDKAPKYLGPDYGQHKAFRQWLIDMIHKHHVKMIVAEDLIMGHGYMDIRKLGEFHGILHEVCETCDVALIKINPTHLKLWATGKGNADKKMMVDACEKRWHIEPQDDNEADAVHLFFYLCQRYKLNI